MVVGGVLGACGAVGDPLPPLQNLPRPASDLTVRQVGRHIEIAWTWPLLTTEGTIAREIGGFTVWAVDVPGFSSELTPETINQYRRPVRALDTDKLVGQEPGSRLQLQSPLSDWQEGQTTVVVVTASNRSGRDAGYSNQARLQPLDPPDEPRWIEVKSAPDGVALSWEPTDRAEEYSVERADGEGGAFESLGRLAITAFLDRSAVRGQTYRYRLRPYRMSEAGWIEGPLSEESEVTLEDTFPPAPPRGLRAVRARASVEISWLPSPEPDVSGYRLLRDGDDLSGPVGATTFSDESAVPDTAYAYTLTAIDTAGNESEPSAPIRVPGSRVPID